MRQVCCLYEVNSCQKAGHREIARPRHINPALSIDDILFLQDVFLTGGIHHIIVPDVISGRKIVDSFLQSLNCHHEVSCLTVTEIPPIQGPTLNICSSLASYCGQDDSYEHVEEFFLEQYFADFMWIENLKDLLHIPLVARAIQAMHDLDIVQNIPVVAISYNACS